MSSSSSLHSQGAANGHSRRRTTSLGANEPSVVTTDKIRPDWAKKLSDARAHALRRAAAATALHNAAYVLGNAENAGRFTLGRRRRTLFGNDSSSGSGADLGSVGALLAAAERHGTSGSRPDQASQDLFPGRHSSRRSRIEDLEELMMMEAIRLSLAAEEERKRKEEKETEKQKKKEEKQKAKDQKKAEKAAKKSALYPSGRNASNFSQQTAESSTAPTGKGKAVDRSGSAGSDAAPTGPTISLTEPIPTETKPKDDAQRHLEQSRAQIGFHASEPAQISPNPFTNQPYHRHALRNLSNASSSASSFAESANLDSPANMASSFEPSPNASGLNLAGEPGLRSETPPGGGAGTEPMFNFRSLAAVIGDEDKEHAAGSVHHLERVATPASSENGADGTPAGSASNPFEDSAHTLEDSALTLRPTAQEHEEDAAAKADSINVAEPPLLTQMSNPYDAKHYGDVSVLEGPVRANEVSEHR
jgi:hypothetical protein